AYKSGARVVAVNVDKRQLHKSREFLLGYKNSDPSRLRFEECNLYELPAERRRFDEIICFEVLEHLLRDGDVAREFYRILRPGGVLHLCCPYQLHPRNRIEVLDIHGTGGHVRPGYTEEDYRALLEPIGFQITDVVGVGTPAVYQADRILRAIRNRFGDLLALPLFALTLPLVWSAKLDPPVPFSLYVKAEKRADPS